MGRTLLLLGGRSLRFLLDSLLGRRQHSSLSIGSALSLVELLLGQVQPVLEVLLVLLLGGVLEEGQELLQFRRQFFLGLLVFEELDSLLDIVPLLLDVLELQLVLLLDLPARGLVLVGRLYRRSARVPANSLLVRGVDVLLQIVAELLISISGVLSNLVTSLGGRGCLRWNGAFSSLAIALAAALDHLGEGLPLRRPLAEANYLGVGGLWLVESLPVDAEIDVLVGAPVLAAAGMLGSAHALALGEVLRLPELLALVALPGTGF